MDNKASKPKLPDRLERSLRLFFSPPARESENFGSLIKRTCGSRPERRGLHD